MIYVLYFWLLMTLANILLYFTYKDEESPPIFIRWVLFSFLGPLFTLVLSFLFKEINSQKYIKTEHSLENTDIKKFSSIWKLLKSSSEEDNYLGMQLLISRSDNYLTTLVISVAGDSMMINKYFLRYSLEYGYAIKSKYLK